MTFEAAHLQAVSDCGDWSTAHGSSGGEHSNGPVSGIFKYQEVSLADEVSSRHQLGIIIILPSSALHSSSTKC